MSGERSEHPGVVPLDRVPDPAFSYDIAGDVPVIRAMNGAFRNAFAPVDTGDDLRETFARANVVVVDGSIESFCDGHDVVLRVATSNGEGAGTRRYLSRTIGPAEDRPGYAFLLDAADAEQSASSRQIDRVASVISHDLRNPLDVAKARLQAARETGESEHFDRVAQAHDRMERIIQDVLTVARGEESIRPDGPIDFGASARDAWGTVETDGATLEIADDLPTAVADRDRVERLFENLFRNAVEHAGDRPTVSVGRIESDGVEGIYVSDDGPGIAAAHRSEVFEPGYSSHEHGTGLGLAIVEGIVTAHGWSIAVTSARQGGARFEITGIRSE